MKGIQKLFTLAACFIFIFTTGWSGSSALAQNRIPLRVGYLPILAQLPLIVSYQNDRMRVEKIDLKLVRYNSFTALEAALRVGAVDVASLPVPIVLGMAADGHKIKIIAKCHSGGSYLVSRTKGRLENIKRKLFGVPGLDSNENLHLGKVLSGLNLRPGLDFKTIAVPLHTAIEDLRDRKLDALYLPEPYGTLAENNGHASAVEGQEALLNGPVATVLAMRADTLKKNSTGIEEWLTSIWESCRFIEKDVLQTGARQTAIIQEAYFTFPKKIVSFSLSHRKGNLKFDNCIPNVEAIKAYSDMAIRMKILTKSVNLDNILFLKLIEQVYKHSKSG